MKILCALFAIAMGAAAEAQDGGKLEWKGKAETPDAALADAKSRGKPALLFFTSLGCSYCSKISAGAFSDDGVVGLSSGFVCVFVDCDWGKKNVELSERFKITGYPTIAFCDPQGKDIGRLNSRDPGDVIKELKSVLEKFGPLPIAPLRPPLADYSPATLKQAGAGSRLLLVFFYDDSPASTSVTQALMDDVLKDLRGRFECTRCEFRKDSEVRSAYDIPRAPTILVLDPALDRPAEKPIAKISGSRSARELRRDLEEALTGRAKAPSTADPATPARSNEPDSPRDLSDDEVDRKFIQARLTMALDFIKKGKKAKAIDVLEDVVLSFPKHVQTLEARKLLAELKK